MDDSSAFNLEILDYLNDSVFIVSQDGTIRIVNEAACKQLGYPKETLLTMKLYDLVLPELTNSFQEYINYCLHNGSALFETAYTCKNGTTVPVEINVTTITYDGLPCFIGIARDITLHKLTEKALYENQARLKTITNNMTDAVWIIDLEFNIVYISPSIEKMLGFPVEEYIKRNVEERYPHEVMQKMYALLIEEIENDKDPESDKNRTRIIEIQEYKKDGTLADLSVHVKFLRDKAGNPTGIIGVSRDISEQKNFEKALKESEEKFRILAESTPMTIVMYQDDKWIYANPAAVTLLEYSEQELYSMNFWDVVHPDDKAIVMERGRKRQKGEDATVGYEFRVVSKSGMIKWVLLYGATVLYKGKPAGLITVLDITERKKIEKEKNKLQEQLLQSQKMESIGTLAGGVAHEFNNMLNIIAGHAELALLNIPQENEACKDIEQIKKAVQRSAEITKKLLTFARKHEKKESVINLNHVIDSMIGMLTRLIGENIHLTWEPADNELWVKIDPASIDQIIVNLCVNARDAIRDHGAITIKTKTAFFNEEKAKVYGVTEGDFVLIEISDDGCGMEEETISHIFDPFFTTKEVGKGTGLGLTTMYGIVKNNGGFIDVSSKRGSGTVFSIYIPQFIEKKHAPIHDEAIQKLYHGTETILLVEDEISIMSMIKKMLENLGYTVLATDNPYDALEIVKNYIGTIHLLLTDVIMPKMNGVDLAKLVSAMYPQIKILFTSGYSAEVLLKHNINAGEINYLSKPVSFTSLASAVRTILDN